MPFERAREIIQQGLAERAFPAAVVRVGSATGVRWHEAFGRLFYDPLASRTELDTVFDLASLTKVIVTTTLAMAHVARGRMSLGTRVGDVLDTWRGNDRRGVTVGHLLDHSSGLPAHDRLWERASGRDAYAREIGACPLEYRPGQKSVYSDPGFILLGLVIERLGGATLDRQFQALRDELGGALQYRPPPELRTLTAPTEHDPARGGFIQGEVHDENAAALGGVAGHAGLFGTAEDIGRFAAVVLRTFHEETWLGSPDMMRLFAGRRAVDGSSRALGWDTMLPTSSCGRYLSPSAIGHTGFTGTSLWIDWERDLYVVFLTNRVHPTRSNEKLLPLRAQLHEAIVEGLSAPAGASRGLRGHGPGW